jgi:hypothetical protein
LVFCWSSFFAIFCLALPPPPLAADAAAAAADDPRAGAVTYDPLCEFINPLLDDDEKLDCGQEP